MALNTNNNKKGYNQLVLRSIGMICTAIGAVQIALYPANQFMSLAAWVAFPIFAYLLCEGLDNSMGKTLYGTRLFVYAALAEVPFNLMSIDRVLFARVQNPLFTLFVGYLMIAATDFIRKKADNRIITILAEAGFTIFGTYVMKGLGCLYGDFAMIYIMLFYISRHIHYPRIFQTIASLYIAFYLSTETIITPIIGGYQYDISKQVIVLLALVLIWLYNGERGNNSLPVRYVSYGFMAALCTVLWGIAKSGVLL